MTTDVYRLNEKPCRASGSRGIASRSERRGHERRQSGRRDGRWPGGRRATTRRRGSWNCFRRPWRIGSGRSSRCRNIIAATFIARRKTASAGQTARTDFDPQYMPLVEWPKDAQGEVYTLLPIFRLPHLIHTRSGNSKFLYEIAHKNPLWVNPTDAREARRHSHRRSAQGAYRDRIFRAARLGDGRAGAGRGGLLSSHGPLAH